MSDMRALYNIIGYVPGDEELFVTAVTHSSCGLKYNNEKLEFLGDAVLELISSEFLFSSFTDMNEGELSKLRSEIVCENALYEWALSVGFGRFLRLGKGEELTGGRSKPSILSDAVEAVIAAIYLDGGYESAKSFALTVLTYLIKLKDRGMLFTDAKTALQEILQKDGGALPVYEVVKTEGPPHARIFVVSVSFGGGIAASGTGSSKKQAEQNAARSAILKLRN